MIDIHRFVMNTLMGYSTKPKSLDNDQIRAVKYSVRGFVVY